MTQKKKWEELYYGWKSSGQTQLEYCKSKGIPYGRFRNKTYKLGISSGGSAFKSIEFSSTKKVASPYCEISHGGRSIEKHSQVRDVIFNKKEILSKTEGRTETKKFNNYAKKVIQEILDPPESQARIRYDIEASDIASFEVYIKNTGDSQEIDVIRFRGFITNFKPSDEAIGE